MTAPAAAAPPSGIFFVNFPGSVAGCAYLATLGHDTNVNVDDSPGFATIRNGSANDIVVLTYNSAGAATDRGFHVGVIC